MDDKFKTQAQKRYCEFMPTATKKWKAVMIEAVVGVESYYIPGMMNRGSL